MALTGADVAVRAGVSRSTVSYILNGHGHRFSAATRAAVEKAVAELGYRPQAAARALVRGESDLVLVVLPIAAGGGIGALIDALTDRLAERGLFLLMTSATASLETFESMITTVRPRAVVAMADLSTRQREILRAVGARTTELARELSAPGGINWAMGRLQVEHLVERGYRRIAYARLLEARDDVLMAAREGGVREACRDAGLPEPQVVTVALRADTDLDAVRALPAGTGVACYNDDTAAAALAAAHVIGRDVPAAIGLVGIDDTPVAAQTSPRLTTIGYGDRSSVIDRLAAVAAGESGGVADVDPAFLRLVQREST